MSTPRSVARAGFTLLEMVVVLALVGIVFSIVAPRMRLSRPMEVQLAGMELVQDIDVARTRALTTRLLVRICFDFPSSYGGFLDDDGDGVISETAAEWQALRGFGVRSLPTNVRYGRGSAPAVPDNSAGGDRTFPALQLHFDARGLVTPINGGGTVYLQSTTDPMAVVAVSVSASGNARLWTYRSGTWQ
jgi:prepilin-type N-terminal cleavage/methylation domain-containing protein